jgi:hypothetical protein
MTQIIHYRGFEIEVGGAGTCTFAQSSDDSPRPAGGIEQARLAIDLEMFDKAWFAPMEARA